MASDHRMHVPLFPMAWKSLPIQIPSFWPSSGTFSLHEITSLGSGIPPPAWVVYLDDFILMAETQKLLRQQVEMTSSLLTSLGFLLNVKKCSLNPSTRLEFLGFVADSTTLAILCPSRKEQENQGMPTHAKQRRSVCKAASSHHWPTLFSNTGSSSCSSSLSGFAKTH